MKQKYNWDKLKLEYFTSSIMEVKGFFEYQYSTYTGHIKEQTKGWSVEKQDFIRNCKEQAESELKEELVELYKPSNEELSQMYKALFYTMRAKAISFYQNVETANNGKIKFNDNISISELISLWKIIRTEQGLPIQYKDTGEDINIENDNSEDIVFYLPDNGR